MAFLAMGAAWPTSGLSFSKKITLGDQNTGKLNLLLAELGDTSLVSSRWLRVHCYSNSLVARYVNSG